MKHLLKVVEPYFSALLDGSKKFEVRRNDRSFQRGDTLTLAEWDPKRCALRGCDDKYCPSWTGRKVHREVTYVYSGDPRFGGIEAGYVVLGLREVRAVELTDEEAG